MGCLSFPLDKVTASILAYSNQVGVFNDEIVHVRHPNHPEHMGTARLLPTLRNPFDLQTISIALISMPSSVIPFFYNSMLEAITSHSTAIS
jgi:hypothetical protein